MYTYFFFICFRLIFRNIFSIFDFYAQANLSFLVVEAAIMFVSINVGNIKQDVTVLNN